MENERRVKHPSHRIPSQSNRSHRASHRCLTNTLMFFNTLFLITGLGSIVVAAWTYIENGRYDIFFGIYKLLHPCGMMISAGGLAVFAMLCGMWSVANQNQCCLRSYISFLVVLLTAEFVAGGIAFSYRTTVKAEVTDAAVDVFMNKYGSGDRGVDYTVDILQERMKCCGAHGWNDYTNSFWIRSMRNGTKYVPASCCSDPQSCALRTQSNLVYPDGCIEMLYELTDLRFKILGAVGIGIGCLQFVCMALAWYYTIIL